MEKTLWLRLKHEIRKWGFRVCPEILVSRDFKNAVGYLPNVEHPQTFNEKITWLKFHYRDPHMVACADKVAVQKYVKEKLGGANV